MFTSETQHKPRVPEKLGPNNVLSGKHPTTNAGPLPIIQQRGNSPTFDWRPHRLAFSTRGPADKMSRQNRDVPSEQKNHPGTSAFLNPPTRSGVGAIGRPHRGVRLFWLGTPPNDANPCGELRLSRSEELCVLATWSRFGWKLALFREIRHLRSVSAFSPTTVLVPGNSGPPSPKCQPLIDCSDAPGPDVGLRETGNVIFGGTGRGTSFSASVTRSSNCSPRNFAAMAAC